VIRLGPLVAAILAAGALAVPAGARSHGLTVNVNRTAVMTGLGRTFVVRSTVLNHRKNAVAGLIAHLNVLSLRDGVYVDPEDWSSHRTRYLPPIAADGSLTLTWKLRAVNAGSFGVYIAVLRQSGSAQPPITGPAVHVSVAHRTTLNSGGILPLALGVPVLLGALTLAVRRRRHTA
jgi:hypothetical protein